MRIGFVVIFLCGLAFQVAAQNSLSLTSRARLRELRLQHKNAADYQFQRRCSRLGMSGTGSVDKVFAMIRLTDDADTVALRESGAEVLHSRLGFAFANVALDNVERVASLPCVRRMEFGNTYRPMLRNARVATGVDKIHQGQGLPQAYTGKGVVCGIVDTGIDPNHINFKGADGKSRVRVFSNITVDDNGNASEKVITGNDLLLFSTDNKDNNHGTHTLGIMTGSYMDELTVAEPLKAEAKADVKTASNPYYGVAYGSEIVAAGSKALADATIAYGVERVLEYAWGNGDDAPQKRSVINLSLGSNLGSHDGNDIINQYFDAVMKQDNPIIVLSSGNEGDMNVAVKKNLTAADAVVRSFLKGYDIPESNGEGLAYKNLRYGGAQVWNSTSRPVKVQVVIYNAARGKVSSRFALTDSNFEKGQYWVTSDSWKYDSSDIVSEDLAKHFEGQIGLLATTDEATGRFYYVIDFQLSDKQASNANGQYMVGLEVTGEEGDRVEMYCNSAQMMTQFTNYSTYKGVTVDGWSPGSADGSINSIACGDNTIVVGSYNTSDCWGSIDGYLYSPGASYDFTYGDVSFFTSYGALNDGTTRPHVCAPGAIIVSSTNRYYTTYEQEIAAQKPATVRPYNWVGLQGTSQAAPHVAGAIALWLEADPTLTVGEVKDIISKTAIRDAQVDAAVKMQFGAGKFDAYEGLKEVLRRAVGSDGVRGVSSDAGRLLLDAVGGGRYSVFLAGSKSLDVCVYHMNGTVAYRRTFDGDEAVLDLSSLPAAPYIFRVNGSHSRTVVVSD